MDNTRYIFVTGGVTSSLGKGIVSASLAMLLQSRGYKVTIQKFDPYLNIDPGTLNPYEHGECYVTEDGAETDLDLGHYERFLNIRTSQANNVTTGAVYNNVISAERQGKFLGKTVQVVPHITDEIKRNIFAIGQSGKYDIIITEIGGCVGDIESLPFVEAVRQARFELGEYKSITIHLTLIPFLKASGELKTKPTQHSVKTLLEAGVQPDILVCRSEYDVPTDIRQKIALFCNVHLKDVIQSIDAESIYDVPLLMKKEELDRRVLEKFRLPTDPPPQIDYWKEFLGRLKNPTDEVRIALIGKYVELPDTYKSIVESFTHAGAANECKVNLKWIHSDYLDTEDKAKEAIMDMHGILVAPGFGERGIEGKINAIKVARENNIPFFGICLGMQCAVVEFARNVLEMNEAASTEQNPETPYPVISIMESQKQVKQKGGTMRLGSYPCKLVRNTLASEAYGSQQVMERHRHRYEFNNDYLEDFKKKGMKVSGINPDGQLVEIMELKNHPWFVGVQFHPELRSTVVEPHPLFKDFIKAAIKQKRVEYEKGEV